MLGLPEQLSRGHGGGLDRLHRCHAPAHHVDELLGIPSVRINAGIRPERNPDPSPDGALKTLALELADLLFLGDDLVGVFEAGVFGQDLYSSL